MSLAPALVLSLAAHCTPGVEPTTMVAIARAESGLDPLAIGVNRPIPDRIVAKTKTQAAATARRLIATGADLDLGLAQINSRNLARLGLSIEAAFDPCQNLAAAGRVLAADYVRGRPGRVGAQPALRTALSYYNSGSAKRGFANGYVARVIGQSATVIPKVFLADQSATSPPDWSVFAVSAGAAPFVLHPLILGDAP